MGVISRSSLSDDGAARRSRENEPRTQRLVSEVLVHEALSVTNYDEKEPRTQRLVSEVLVYEALSASSRCSRYLCSRMLMYVRMLTYAHVCSRMLEASLLQSSEKGSLSYTNSETSV
jgi:hypothetical protein